MSSAVIRQFSEALEALRDEPPLTSVEMLEFLQLRNRCEAIAAKIVADFGAVGMHVIDGAHTVAGWLETRGHLTPIDAHRLARRGMVLKECPLVGAAWLSGSVTTDRMDRIETARRNTRDDAAFAALEPRVVEVAAHGRVDDLKMVLACWRVGVTRWRTNIKTIRDHQNRRATSNI